MSRGLLRSSNRGVDEPLTLLYQPSLLLLARGSAFTRSDRVSHVGMIRIEFLCVTQASNRLVM